MDRGGAVRSLPPVLGDLVGRHLGRYQVLGQIAAGGMAGVYVARAHGVAGFERLVAIKVLHPHLAYEEEFISMFLDEARLAARIRHPNVVATLDVSDSKGGGYFLVMEFIEGVNLATLLRQAIDAKERLPEPVVLRMVADGLAGLGAAHELTDEKGEPLRLVHRDVSPHNVMVGVDGISRLTDFGVASASKRLTSTRQGTFKGKISYSAPEQVLQRPVDGRADLFAMGIVLWECLTSHRLFRADDDAATLQKLLHEPIPPPSSVSHDLAVYDAVLDKALQREPDERYQTALELIEALEGLGKPIARARAVGEEVRHRAGARLAEQAASLQEALAAYGSSAVEQPVPLTPRIVEAADVPTVAATDVTHVARKTGGAGRRSEDQSASGSISGLVQRSPRTVVGVVLFLALALAAVAAIAILGARPKEPAATRAPRTKAPATAVQREPVAPAEARPSVPPAPSTAAPAPTAETETPAAPALSKRARPGPQKRRDPSAAPPGDPSEEILLNPYRH